MEYFWYVLSSALAGVGTGLAGLSAATVMVPILIVLCPSFAGETGAYQATAIALASDILGSAVTTRIYIRHKNIDLKRGWIMLVCILSMCTVGSFAAWLAGGVVLGGFTLILTFCIGIRFLLTQRKTPAARGEKLGARGVAISLFFGLTIGFGTGFVGTGGGMMMLVVFTAFLGMDMKTAVGTSTFIMTFTALIASVSHILIHPAILLQRWDALLVCSAVTTLFSRWSAQFANRFPTRVVGLVTGGVLTLLGGAMIALHYRQIWMAWPLAVQTLDCCRTFLCYIGAGAASLLTIRILFRVPSVIFRKLLHFVAFSSVVLMMYAAESWMAACLTSVLFALVVYPILHALEGQSWFASLLTEKKPGEIKKSLLLLFLSQAGLIALCWGLLGHPELMAAATLTWGFGDTAAAWVGKRFGRHHIALPHADHKKTWEGSAAMALTSFVACLVTLSVASPLPMGRCLLYALAAAPVSAGSELFSHEGNDTVAVPYCVAAVLGALTLLLP